MVVRVIHCSAERFSSPLRALSTNFRGGSMSHTVKFPKIISTTFPHLHPLVIPRSPYFAITKPPSIHPNPRHEICASPGRLCSAFLPPCHHHNHIKTNSPPRLSSRIVLTVLKRTTHASHSQHHNRRATPQNHQPAAEIPRTSIDWTDVR